MTPTADATISALRSTHDELAAVVRGLSDEQLLAPSGAAQWPVAQVLSHLGSGAEIGRATLRAATGAGEAPGDGFNQSVWDRWNALSPREQADAFLTADDALVATFEALTPEQRSDLQVDLGFLPAPLPLASYAGMRLNEAAQHSWDVRVAFDDHAAIDDGTSRLLVDHLGNGLGVPRSASPARPTRSPSRPWSASATSTSRSRSPTRSRWCPRAATSRHPSSGPRMPSRASSPVGSPPAGPQTASRSRATSVSTTCARCSRDTEAHRPREGPCAPAPPSRAGACARRSGPVPADLEGVEVAATVPGTVHTDLLDAGLIPDPYLDDNERRPGLDAPHRLALRARRSTAAARAPTSGSTWSSPGSTPSPPSPSTAAEVGPAPRTCTAATAFDVRGAAAPRAATTTADRRPSTRRSSTPRRSRTRLGVRARRLPAAAQHGPQDGLQLRLGLGPDLQTAGHLAARRPSSAGASPGSPTVRPLVTVDDRRRPATSSARRRRARPGCGSASASSRWSRASAASEAVGRVAPARRRAVVDRRASRTRAAVVAARATASSRCTTSRSPCSTADGDRARHLARAGSGFRTVALDTTPDEHGTAVHPRRQRPAGLRPGRQLDPRRPLPHPDHPRAARPPRRPGRRRRTSTCCGSGAAASTRPRTSTTLVRRARAAGLAGLPVRLRGLPGGGAARAARSRPRRASTSTRLTPHPSLVLWNGNNENLWGFMRLGLAGAARRAAPGARATTSSCCPGVVAELDPTRPYWPGSPYSPGARRDRGPPQRPGPRHQHIWEVWNRVDYTALPRRTSRASCSEFGFQGPPT